MPGPLHGFKVIDLTSMVSGPVSTLILADQGADVIKVEAPQGDHVRQVATRRGGFSASFLNNNRNKRSIVLNLKTEAGLNALRRLLKDADVIVQNFRPGVADRRQRLSVHITSSHPHREHKWQFAPSAPAVTEVPDL